LGTRLFSAPSGVLTLTALLHAAITHTQNRNRTNKIYKHDVKDHRNQCTSHCTNNTSREKVMIIMYA
ncbi:MAG: hypothetical protein QXK25_07635, partial [Ignisphaera sp.]